MAKPKYRITQADYVHARLYLGRTMRFRAPDSFAKATKGVDAKKLNDWCEEHLVAEEWQKLKVAIRKRRERWERGRELATITVSAKAHALLRKIAKRDNVTFSTVLEKTLAQAWRKR